MLFDSFRLDRRLLRAVDHLEWLEATPIQDQAIPHALEGRDVLACARTGSGKTGAFVLPTMHRLLHEDERRERGPRVLVLCPTRELAMQVGQQMVELGRYTRLRSACIVGGEAYPPQIRELEQGLDLLVGTPGRLLDHLRSGKLHLDQVETLVLDEADRMLDMGFIDDVMRLARACPTDRQTLFFSATLDGAVDSVANRLVREPIRVEVDQSDTRHTDIEEYVLRADNDGHKQDLVLHLCRDPEMTRALMFVATKSKADDEARLLRSSGYDVVALHGDLPQAKRTKVVERLRSGNVRIVVATDVAARGLDIDDVTHVVNYDMPRTPREYVHRIGRTGRAGAKGVAVSLVTPADWIKLADIERFRGEPLPRMVIPGKEPTRPAPVGSRSAAESTGRRRYGRRGGIRRRTTPETDDS
ncbi:MAG TPA: DEAD/DEAH box helicase [Candidatus Krumholzibacteria bacterium]|nr:DEAD/DEAH box helicase [Candidatus Krumholzibacteria bacterium]